MPTSNREINLIPSKKFEEHSRSRKVFIWMVGVGRVIIIITELVAVLVWLSRFNLDYQITTLQENIENKAASVATSKRFETNVRRYQNKIKLLKELEQEKIFFSQGLNKLSALSPQEVRFTKINLQPQQIQFNAIADTAASFALLISSLISSEDVQEIRLTSTQYDYLTDSYLFFITIKIEQGYYTP